MSPAGFARRHRRDQRGTDDWVNRVSDTLTCAGSSRPPPQESRNNGNYLVSRPHLAGQSLRPGAVCDARLERAPQPGCRCSLTTSSASILTLADPTALCPISPSIVCICRAWSCRPVVIVEEAPETRVAANPATGFRRAPILNECVLESLMIPLTMVRARGTRPWSVADGARRAGSPGRDIRLESTAGTLHKTACLGFRAVRRPAGTNQGHQNRSFLAKRAI